MPVEPDALADRAGVRLGLAASAGASLAGAREALSRCISRDFLRAALFLCSAPLAAARSRLETAAPATSAALSGDSARARRALTIRVLTAERTARFAAARRRLARACFLAEAMLATRHRSLGGVRHGSRIIPGPPAVSVFEFDGKRPQIDPDAYVAPTAVLVGDVRLGAGVSVWFGAVLRGDDSWIEVGEGTNIQDNAMVHCAEDMPTLIGVNATVGHNALLEGCVVEDGALVGTGAIMLQRSRLGAGAMLAAGAVLGEGQEIPAGHLAAGVPATIKKKLSGSSADWIASPAPHYQKMGQAYRRKLRPGD